MRIRPRRSSRRTVAAAAFLLAAAALIVGFTVVAQARAPRLHTPLPASTQLPKLAATTASQKIATDPAARALVASAAASGSVTSALVAQPRATTPAGPSIDVYRGLGTWVDIYDARAWANPAAAVRNMASHGVRTLYIETSNSRSRAAVMYPAQLRTFIVQAHAHHIQVVAWYLPDLNNLPMDYSRIKTAITFTAPGGQKFDSFALDIESPSVASQSVRNAALASLSTRIRTLAGPSYPLGAIIPSPLGLAKKGSYWGTLPYTMLASKYDVFLPMSYYSYHVHGATAVAADTAANVRILRSKKGCSATPIHMIGGIAENSTPAEVGAFVRVVRQTKCFGASIYGWPGTSAGEWQQLRAVR